MEHWTVTIHPEAEVELAQLSPMLQIQFLFSTEMLLHAKVNQLRLTPLKRIKGCVHVMRIYGEDDEKCKLFIATHEQQLQVLHFTQKTTANFADEALRIAESRSSFSFYKLFSTLRTEMLLKSSLEATYHSLTDSFGLAKELTYARYDSGLTQQDVAERMGTTQSTVARLEGGKRPPSLRTVQRYAQAVGCRAVVRIERAPV